MFFVETLVIHGTAILGQLLVEVSESKVTKLFIYLYVEDHATIFFLTGDCVALFFLIENCEFERKSTENL